MLAALNTTNFANRGAITATPRKKLKLRMAILLVLAIYIFYGIIYSFIGEKFNYMYLFPTEFSLNNRTLLTLPYALLIGYYIYLMKQVRNDIQLLRVIATLFIVVGHCFAIYGVWRTPIMDIKAPTAYFAITPLLVYFALPIFVVISGYLTGGGYSRQMRFGKFVIGKVKRLYLPGVIFSLLYLLCFDRSEFSHINTLLLSVFVNGAGHLWFLYVLFAVYTLSYPIHRLIEKIDFLSVLLFSATTAFASCFFDIGLGIASSLFYQFFFVLGLYWGRRDLSRKVRRFSFGKIAIVVAGYIVAFALFSLLKGEIQSLKPFQESEALHLFQHLFYRLSIGAIASTLIFILIPVQINRCSSFILRNAALSFKIYVIHQFVLMSLLNLPPSYLLRSAETLGLAFPFVLVVCVLSTSYLLALLMEKIPLLNKAL